MLTQDYINGRVDTYNKLLFTYRHELLDIRYGYYNKLIHCNQYKNSRFIILKHIKSIKSFKNDLKQLIKRFNSQSDKRV